MKRRSGLTLVEALFVTAVGGVLVAVVLPTIAQCRARSLRTGCAMNLGLSLDGLRLYAEGYGGAFPTCGYGPGTERYDIIGYRCDRPLRVAHSNSRNLFLAVRLGFLEPGMLLCPETDDRPAPLGPPDRPYHDFHVGNGPHYRNRFSYSYHLQFGDRGSTRGHPLTAQSSPSMAILADRTPCVRYAGLPRGEGTRSIDFGPPAWAPLRRANSPNHLAAGQNVAFIDGRVAWAAAPTAGPDGDNIYTVWAGGDRAGGAIDPGSMPRGPTDCFLVP